METFGSHRLLIFADKDKCSLFLAFPAYDVSVRSTVVIVASEGEVVLLLLPYFCSKPLGLVWIEDKK